MYDSSNRENTPREVSVAAMGDMEILEKAIALVKENAPEHRELIGRLAAAAQAMAGLEYITGLDERLKNYTDRSKTLA